MLIPGSVEECYEITIEALDLAQQFQTPVFVATDLDLGMNLWLSDPSPIRPSRSSAAKCSMPRTWNGSAVRAVQGRRWRRHLLPYHSRDGASAGRLLHPGYGPQRQVRLQRAAGRLEEEPRPPGPEAGDGATGASHAGDRERDRLQGWIDRLRQHAWASWKPATGWPRKGSRPTICRLRALPIRRSSVSSSSGTSGSTSSSKTAMPRSRRSCKSALSGALADRWFRSRTTTARRSPLRTSSGPS